MENSTIYLDQKYNDLIVTCDHMHRVFHQNESLSMSEVYIQKYRVVKLHIALSACSLRHEEAHMRSGDQPRQDPSGCEHGHCSEERLT